MDWYYAIGSEQKGPLSEDAFKQFARQSNLGPDTLVWHEGLPAWTTLSTVCPEFFQSHPSGHPKVKFQSDSDAARPLQEGEHVCAISGQIDREENMIRFGELWVCQPYKDQYLSHITQGAHVPGTFNYGGFLIRALALSLDHLILLIAGVVIFFALGGWGFFSELTTATGTAKQLDTQNIETVIVLAVVIFVSGPALYFIFFTGKFGATPGKMVCGLKVVRADGNPVSYLLATGRYFASLISGSVYYLGYLTVLFDNQKRALHDYLCNTRVVLTSKG